MTAHGVFRFESGPDIMRTESCFLLQEAHEEFGGRTEIPEGVNMVSRQTQKVQRKSAERACGERACTGLG
jgi:hypothetical protein